MKITGSGGNLPIYMEIVKNIFGLKYIVLERKLGFSTKKFEILSTKYETINEALMSQ
jgi:hypothetical protein